MCCRHVALHERCTPGSSRGVHAVDWYLLCMELLSSSEGWKHPSEVPEADISSAKEAALEAIKMAHELTLAPGCTTVHGDARSPNIRMRLKAAGKTYVSEYDMHLVLLAIVECAQPEVLTPELVSRSRLLTQFEHACCT